MKWKEQIPSDVLETGTKVFDSFPDDEEGFKNLLKSYQHAQSLVGEDRVKVPNDKSTPEEIKKFREKIGVPQDKDSYEIEGVDEEFSGKLKELGITEGLTKKQMASVSKVISENIKAKDEEDRRRTETKKREVEEALRKDLGDDYELKIKAVNSMVNQLGSDSFQKFAETELGQNADVVKFLIAISDKFIAEDSSPGKDRSFEIFGQGSPDRAKAEMNRLSNDKEFVGALSNPSALNHKEVKDTWANLQKEAFGEFPS